MNKKTCYYFQNPDRLKNLEGQSLAHLTELANKHRLSILFENENADVFEFLAKSHAKAAASYFLRPLITHYVLPSRLITQKSETTGLVELISEKPLVNAQFEKLLLQDFDIFINFPKKLELQLVPYVPYADFETDESALLAQS